MRATSVRIAALVALALLGAAPSLALDVVGQQTVPLSFSPASGPVAGYFVFLQREGDPAPGRRSGALPPSEIGFELSGNYGETITVRVQPYAANGQLGPFSPPSQPITFVPDVPAKSAPNELDTNTGLVFATFQTGTTVLAQVHRSDLSIAGSFTIRPSSGAFVPAFLDIRAARCDFDGDGAWEYALGFGTGSRGRVELRRGQSGSYALIGTIDVGASAFYTRSGETFPSCGDVDGDGLDELLIGRGRGGDGIVDVYDDASAGFAFVRSFVIDWAEYASSNGETRPAAGDFDGDGLAEVAIGVGAGGDGMVALVDDLRADFAPLWTPAGPQRGWMQIDRASADGSTWPAAVQLDGDGARELVVGLGKGSNAELAFFEDATRRAMVGLPFFPLGVTKTGSTSIFAGFSQYNAANGAAWPSAIDLDANGIDEVLVGLREGGLGRVQLLREGANGPAIAGSTWLSLPQWILAPKGPGVAR